MFNRREFFKRGVCSGAAAWVVSPFITIEMVGCSASEIESAINTVLQSGESVLKVIDPSSAWFNTLADAIAALQQAESGWQSGGAITLVSDALNTIEAVLAVIPFFEPYAVLIEILVAGIEACLALIPSSAKSLKLRATANPYRGITTLRKPHFLQSTAGAYREQWNNAASSNPALALARL
jgi:hypothetical protein